jgi:hypothetical protein
VTRHRWLPLTYAPKIPGVLSGEIRLTIRVDSEDPLEVGDMIAFHGWQGRPYRSPWSFRTEWFTLDKVDGILLFPQGIRFATGRDTRPWTHDLCDQLAILDGIESNPGESPGRALGRVLNEYHKIPDAGVKAQVLRW